jgi:hypothetical protein
VSDEFWQDIDWDSVAEQEIEARLAFYGLGAQESGNEAAETY